MKKRGLLFAGIFFLFLVILYMQPVWFPRNSTEDETTEQAQNNPPATNLSYEPIQTAGFANWIGQDLDEFEESYGQPEESMRSGFSFTVNRYAVDGEFLEVNTEDHAIKSIKYLGGKDDEIEPFHFGMTMDELAKITMIYPNFTIEHQDASVDFELEEDDMNYRPLIAFDNGSFAILFFDQTHNESQLYAVDYLDSETLLKLAPYTVANDEAPYYEQEEDADWEKINQFKEQQTIDLIQLLREKNEVPTFSIDANLQIAGKQILSSFDQNKEDILTTERLQALQRIEQGHPGSFVLNDTEMTDLLEELEDPSVSGHLEQPVYDPSFSVLSWYSTPVLYDQLIRSDETSLGVAFSKENVLVLWKESEYQTEESESN
ncbi:MAG: hypothetical protein L0I95_01730 [Tetragenococcus koreensis]|uniref:CAP-associated domain-containing protein n=1 Tax=Tetragenococcus koreensis TaxID=290335 RepID=UPI001EEDABD7|nr:CAP-associated domain-containing protein [Tetragenococcus koreensis]MCF1621556.1 hypothetical protein [Tetragenococcus koreensis]MCF1677586.1 hypothetical protein [Tetragenococcus koreensis]MCF1682297.1 hypothetical protein [Tetragenococcus koreensis]MCF1687191.1 hypothetical protein [Tetragenococcus koreensis]MDN5809962.1 hypothetical protein [Tetragenococcus koreensis]